MSDHPRLQDVVRVAVRPRKEPVYWESFVSVLECSAMCKPVKKALQLARQSRCLTVSTAKNSPRRNATQHSRTAGHHPIR